MCLHPVQLSTEQQNRKTETELKKMINNILFVDVFFFFIRKTISTIHPHKNQNRWFIFIEINLNMASSLVDIWIELFSFESNRQDSNGPDKKQIDSMEKWY